MTTASPPAQHSPAETSSNNNPDEQRPPSPLILYKPPTPLSLLRTTAINLVLPFINGLMLGFGELFAHEIAFRLGWGTTRIFPESRLRNPTRRSLGPGVEVREQPADPRSRAGSLADLTSME